MKTFELPSLIRPFYLGFEGPKFTWKGPKVANDHIWARLDRRFASTSFSQLFPSCKVQTKSVNHFDQLALHISLFNISANHTGRKYRPKRFEPHWTKEEECLEFFDNFWILENYPTAGSVRTNLSSILDHLLD